MDDVQKKEAIDALEQQLYNQPLVKELSERAIEAKSALRVRSESGVQLGGEGPKSLEDAEFLALRPFVNRSPEQLQHQFTAGSLRGLDMFAIPPLVFSKTKHGAEKLGGSEGDGTVIVHVGRDLCGYEGVVHGGLTATMFDEALARTAFYALPHHMGVTAKLQVVYFRPVPADQFLTIETEVLEGMGRKAFVKGYLRAANSEAVLAEAEALFVEPKWVKYASWVGGLNVQKLLEE
ncbi:hypothetical protein MVES1_000356 [Malassezia vespertilionis]|uniref:Thioesterase domain-containing protein n=1 Tax=Malassezia vespertilionis TaxID=2020962 RepID=A0A2N1JFY2_9BASI|nr:uncharacterized protein MVES1_000356 [Malassezia vespertilionis]PKI85460.1 hypothetical protein MVES_000336 [Malassezia vespertilionis]WFD05031.1 hypothetical protein MVES1_000356 [Malassezia vespertilionis]